MGSCEYIREINMKVKKDAITDEVIEMFEDLYLWIDEDDRTVSTEHNGEQVLMSFGENVIALAPYIESGSYIEVETFGELSRYLYNGVSCTEVSPKIIIEWPRS